MGAVLSGSPVVPDSLEQLLGAVLRGSRAGAVESVFFGGVDDFAPAQFLAFPPHGQKLPATAEAGFFGTYRDALNAPTNQAPVFLNPAGVIFRGKKIFGESLLRLLQNATLVAFEPPEVIRAQVLRDQAAGLLLALHGIGRDQGALQRAFGQLAQQRL